MDTTTLVILLVIVILIAWMVTLYNRLVSLKANRENAFSDIDVQLKLRFDLVPNIVNTVKWYAKHEKEVLNQVMEARTGFMNAKTIDGKVAANNELNGALKTLFAVAEAYPELKANQNFLRLQEDLSDVENKLAAARRYFNSATKDYNIAVQQFPSVIVARIAGFTTYEYFEIDNPEEKNTPNVEF